MASAQEWQLSSGAARVFPANGENLAKPVIMAGGEVGPTDFPTFEAGIDHRSYSFLAELHARGHDLILVGYESGSRLADQAKAVEEAVRRASAERYGDDALTVGGVGRGALAARYALARQETNAVDHQTGTYFSYNGTSPSHEEDTALQSLGNWPRRPRTLKLVSRDFADGLSDADFDEATAGAADQGGPLITKELGTWLLDRLS
ncbi:hypothetical protein PV721_14205 [Streptomyces sp. MB09-01]|uniref:hypothetical protein n=1 Tax=Streptomyces sp. MB09-01 TaxID=3028666 RepID=UPI0029B50225|nr:hypothetical protein [Streptomyces sp. MB09-01]MDX3535496.1 hypothetical protein [Streptomyces sp. MB09-01]